MILELFMFQVILQFRTETDYFIPTESIFPTLLRYVPLLHIEVGTPGVGRELIGLRTCGVVPRENPSLSFFK